MPETPKNPKRRRDTATSPPARVPSSPGEVARVRSPPKKKVRARLGEEDESSSAIDEPDDAEGAANSSDDGGDRGLAAVAARIKQPRRPRLVSGEEKRTRFRARYEGMTHEEVLVVISKGWRSKVYDHFRAPEIVPTDKGGATHRFVCKKYPSKHVDRIDHEDSTGNLKRHVDCCDPDDTPEAEQISAFAHGSTYSPARLRVLLALWVARRHRPFLIVEDPELRKIFRMLYAKAALPSRSTVARDVQLLAGDAKAKLIALLINLPFKLHICVDGWTSPNVLAFLGITVHWHHAGEIRHVILDFVRLTGAHTGSYLAEKLVKCLMDFQIAEKILAVTCDNADNNRTMLNAMTKLIPAFRGTRTRVRCFGHILNLVVKAILSQFGPRKMVKSEESDSDDRSAADEAERQLRLLDDDDANDDDAESGLDDADADRETADDAVLDQLDEDHPELILSRTDIQAGQVALKKVLQLSKKVWNSPSVRSELSKLAADADLNSEVLVRSVKTRWNTVTEVIKRALEMREVLGDLCDMAQFNKRDGVRLRRFLVNDEEWQLLAELHELLDAFLVATKEISTSTRALVHEVIPYIDVLTEHLDNFADDEDLEPSVRAAARRGLNIMNKYYERTDETIVYRVAMILHPAYKTAYFREHKWPEEWIEEALSLVKQEWETHYKPAAASDVDHGPGGAPPEESASHGHKGKAPAASGSHAPVDKGKNPAVYMSTGSQKPRGPRPGLGRFAISATPQGAGAKAARLKGAEAMFARIKRKDTGVDVLDKYLDAPPVSTVDEPLEHWHVIFESAMKKAKESNSEPGPEAALARMALDFLTCPATSTDAERAFSRGHLTVSRLRHSLGEESVRSSTVLGSWASIPEVVDEDVLTELLKSHSAHKEPRDRGKNRTRSAEVNNTNARRRAARLDAIEVVDSD